MTDPITQSMMQGAAGASSSAGLYVDEVFKTYLYTGQSSTITNTNGIDNLGEGGLLWVKNRDNSRSHVLYDTERLASGSNTTSDHCLSSDSNNAAKDMSPHGTVTWKNDGWSVPNGDGDINQGGFGDFVSWNFRKAPGFFDVVTYSGAGGVQNISHNLGSIPGCIMIKRIDSSNSWRVYHRGTDPTHPQNYALCLNDNTAVEDFTYWNDTAPTATQFTVADSDVNGAGGTYVAYLFAHDEQIFGEGGNNSIIKCDYYVGNASSHGTQVDIELGWEPQWILIKKISSSSTSNWILLDTNRKWKATPINGSTVKWLDADTNDTESEGSMAWRRNTGFSVRDSSYVNGGNGIFGNTFIYIAIRRDDGLVGKPPATAQNVFGVANNTGNTPSFTISNNTVDWQWFRTTNAEDGWMYSRAREPGYLALGSSSSMGQGGTNNRFDFSNGWYAGNASNYISWMWHRWAGFEDIVYRGTGSARTLNHYMGGTPEMVWIKNIESGYDWQVWHKDLTAGNHLILNSSAGAQTTSNSPNITATETTIGMNSYVAVNANNQYHEAVLFRSMDGFSKVGSFAGSDSAQTINLGFSPRFLFIKNINASEYWPYFDTTRGFSSLLMLNNGNAGTTNSGWVTATASGMTLAGQITALNRSGYTFIYYAHA